MSQFEQDIRKFNAMYRMNVADKPTLDIGLPLRQRLLDLKKILHDEVDEVEEIISMIDGVSGQDMTAEQHSEWKLKVLTAIADLMGDIQVYAASEMTKFGLPVDKTLSIIMQSNFSKMGADGKPIYDEFNKLQKGPNYWKPEPKLSEMINSHINDESTN